MKWPDRDALTRYVSGAAILAFAVVLAIALIQLSETQDELRRNSGDNMLWAISRAQLAAVKFETALGQQATTGAAGDELVLRHQIMLSRINLLEAGPQRRYLETMGLAGPVIAAAEAARAASAGAGAIEKGDVDEAAEIGAAVAPFAKILGRAANAAMVRQLEETGRWHDAVRDAVDGVLLSVLGIVILGAVICFSMIRALSEKHRAQRELEREQQLRDTYRLFVALVSHQFQTPLTVIDASAQRLYRRAKTVGEAEVRRRAEGIRESVRQLTALIRATLETIRLDNRQVSVSVRSCGVGELVERVRVQQSEEMPGRCIDIDVDPAVPDAIRTDPVLVEQVLGNLVSNALKYSGPEAPVSVKVRLRHGKVRFTVNDNGIGISEAERELVFEDFFRAAATQKVPGTGMGLNVSRKVAALLGGSLGLEDKEGPGASFVFDLPVQPRG